MQTNRVEAVRPKPNPIPMPPKSDGGISPPTGPRGRTVQFRASTERCSGNEDGWHNYTPQFELGSRLPVALMCDDCGYSSPRLPEPTLPHSGRIERR